MSHAPVTTLLLRVLLFMIPYYFAWYTGGQHLAHPLILGAGHALVLLWPDAVFQVVQSGAKMLVYIWDPAHFLGGAKVPGGDFISINSLAVTYGTPLFLALAFSSMGSSWQHLRRILAGLLLLGLFHSLALLCWACYLLAQHAHLQQAGMFPGGTWIAAAFQFGFHLTVLVLPPVVPLVLWGWLYRDTLDRVISGDDGEPVADRE